MKLIKNHDSKFQAFIFQKRISKCVKKFRVVEREKYSAKCHFQLKKISKYIHKIDI